ncbi:MAG: radical SAM/SPASM domain-containing protein [Patescibacteria group bacterium]|jgi:MoaA/NifB/PqqE/SkfB family radical SAM enzyme
MSLATKAYNFIIYNRLVKRLAGWFLRQRFFNQNYFYQQKYQRLLKNKMGKYQRVPFRVMIENTNACNSNCVFCPHPAMKRKIGNMSMELFQKIVDQCVSLGIDYVTIYGFGEPLLDPEFVAKVKYAKSRGIKRVTTNTNGALLTEERSRALVEAGIDEIYISFDAATAETFRKIRPALNFDKIEKNIFDLARIRKEMGSKKPEIVLSFVETGDNKQEVKKYIKKWQKTVDHISISFIHNWTGDLFDKLKIKQRDWLRDPCRLIWTDMVISWDGTVPLCCNDYENKIILGDINKQTVAEVWGGEKLRQFRYYHQKGEFKSINICADCVYNCHHKSPWWVGK